MYLPELELGITSLVSVSTEDRDKQYKSTPKSHLVGRAKDSPRASERLLVLSSSYTTLMSEPRTFTIL